jgi:hypothetical protein
LSAPAGIRIETPTLWIPSLREADWRIVADRQGDFELTVNVGDESVTKSLRVSDAVVRRSPVRPDQGFVTQLIYPAERPLPAGGPIESIAVTYPARDVRVLGRDMHWMVVFFGFWALFALALRRWFN